MRIFYFLIFLTLITSSFASVTQADEKTSPWKNYVINTEHSEIRFEVPYMGITSVSGQFEDFKGTFQKHRSTGEIRNIHVVIEAKSLNTSDQKRDKHLRSEDFFKVKQFPKIYLTDAKIISTPEREFDLLRGQLTMRGKTRPFVLNAQTLGQKKDQMGREVLFFKALGEVNRQDFGMTWNQTLDSGGWVIGDLVDLTVRVEASPASKRPAFSRFMRPGNDTQGLNEQRLSGATVTKKQPPKQLTELNQRVDKLSKELTNSELDVQKLKSRNKKLSKEIQSLRKQSQKAQNIFTTAAFTLIGFLFIGSTLFFIKRKSKVVLVSLPESKYPLKEKDRFLIEWLCDFALILSFILIIGLSLLWFS